MVIGEAANTGRHGGLRKKLQDHLGRRVLTVWCVCHRSDLALESVEAMVPELKHWLSDLVAVGTYFRTSGKRTSMLRSQAQKTVQFPPHFEVRFAEHLFGLIKAVLKNLPVCRRKGKLQLI